MVRQLRGGSPRNGLILANGGFLSYQHAICISNKPRKDGSTYPDSSNLKSPTTDVMPTISAEAEGKSKIEVSQTNKFLKLAIVANKILHYTDIHC